MSLPENRPFSGDCSRPIRLTSHVDHVDISTGEVRRAFSSLDQPSGVLHVRCNNRRASVCPACSATYKRDARRLVLAGLAGGKGVPDTVTGHPAWFVTLTAPSFGPVHSRRQQGGKTGPVRACHPRRGLCPHGRPAGCHERHRDDDSRLGSPICADCYGYGRTVTWNALVPKLWKATRDATESAVAAAAGLTVAGLRRAARLSFVKVAEMQARGVVHLHVVVRVDGPDGPDSAPPGRADGDLVADALRGVIGSVAVPAPDPDAATLDATAPDDRWAVRWGVQVDIRRIALDGAPRPSGQHPAGTSRSVRRTADQRTDDSKHPDELGARRGDRGRPSTPYRRVPTSREDADTPKMPIMDVTHGGPAEEARNHDAVTPHGKPRRTADGFRAAGGQCPSKTGGRHSAPAAGTTAFTTGTGQS
ncbi:replication initiator [Frankia sp. Mgl5]|uniref:replication initiator n=1 Tax=Frankia sp. Mgl5 TaxID=2933793 RepID=UPI0034D4B4AA